MPHINLVDLIGMNWPSSSKGLMTCFYFLFIFIYLQWMSLRRCHDSQANCGGLGFMASM